MGMAIDSGGFVDNLDRAVARADVAGFEIRRAEAKRDGKLLGLGIACFLETSRGAPNEGAEVRFETDGAVTEFTFTNIRENVPTTDRDFTFLPPAGVQVVEGLPPI